MEWARRDGRLATDVGGDGGTPTPGDGGGATPGGRKLLAPPASALARSAGTTALSLSLSLLLANWAPTKGQPTFHLGRLLPGGELHGRTGRGVHTYALYPCAAWQLIGLTIESGGASYELG
jgi:hypothetical protein